MPRSGFWVVVVAVALCGCSASMLSSGSSAVRSTSARQSVLHSASQSIPMTHLLDFEVIGQAGHRTTLSWSEISPYLTADEPDNASESNAAAAAGEQVGWYTDVAIQHADGPLYTRDETTFAHDCSNDRVTSIYEGEVVYLMDPHSPHLLQLWVDQVRNVIQQDSYHIDYVDADSADDLRKFSSRPCNNSTHTGFDEGDWTHATAKMYGAFEQQSGLPILANALYTPLPNGGHRISPGIGLATSVWGEATEECYSDTSGAGVNPGPAGSAWEAAENAEIAIMATGRSWFCSGDYENSTNASEAIPERLYQLASFLLTYQPGQAYLKQPWVTASNFRQNKETQLVALDPIEPQPTDISGLLTPSGLYAREYGACYIAGALAGPCVALVNPSKTALQYDDYPTYTHTLSISGTDPFDGGTIRTNGAAAPALMPPASAYILFP